MNTDPQNESLVQTVNKTQSLPSHVYVLSNTSWVKKRGQQAVVNLQVIGVFTDRENAIEVRGYLKQTTGGVFHLTKTTLK